MTTNSDLRNDYWTCFGGPRRPAPIDTGSNKVGALIGDHVKTSIGTLLNTGAYVGAMALVVATGGLLPKFIPSFAWLVGGVATEGFGKQRLYETARTAMARRCVDRGRRIALGRDLPDDRHGPRFGDS